MNRDDKIKLIEAKIDRIAEKIGIVFNFTVCWECGDVHEQNTLMCYGCEKARSKRGDEDE